MSFRSKMSRATGVLGRLFRDPRRSVLRIHSGREAARAEALSRGWPSAALANGELGVDQVEPMDPNNPLWTFFQRHREGPGIWKWVHYFDIYHRHLAKFRGTAAHFVEIGVYSGGSLLMWRDYFGPDCRITGVDIEPACRSYEKGNTHIAIGDQEDRGFWKRFRAEAPPIDAILDDGGHSPEQQRITLEETLPYLKPGGVYICEDIHGVDNPFSTYVQSLAGQLNAVDGYHGRRTAFQDAIAAIYLYPMVVVIERSDRPAGYLSAPKHGTEWQPFLDHIRT